jgi:hypothetical protein
MPRRDQGAAVQAGVQEGRRCCYRMSHQIANPAVPMMVVMAIEN